MEILYFYIDNYINLNKLPINFSSKFIFETIQVEGKIKINISENPNYIDNFFNDSNTLNVSAIVGKNGSGKSNILDYIKNLLPKGVGGTYGKSILAYNHNNNHKILITKDLYVEINDNTSLFDIKHHEDIEFSHGFRMPKSFDDFNNTSFIYYSNIVDSKLPSNLTLSKLFNEEEIINHNGLFNISTMALFGSDRESVDPKSKLGIDKIDAYKSKELIRNIELITSDESSFIDFPLPEEIFITIQDLDNTSLSKNKKYEFVYKKLHKYEVQLKREESKGMKFYNTFLKAILLNILRTDLEMSTMPTYSDIFTKIEGDDLHEFTINFISELKIGKINGVIAGFMKEKGEAIADIIDFVFESLVKKQSNLLSYEDTSLLIPLNHEDAFNAHKFFDLYSKVKGLSDFLIFRFRGVSSGQQSVLSLYSRLYYASRKDELCDNVIILFDEGDVYFHPEWQRKFFQRTLEFTQKVFKGKKLQLIFTSNTPFIVSDLPKQNVIFLDYSEITNTVVTRKDAEMQQTFGANIYDLFKDSFFMEKGFIGEFAKHKIEELFDELIVIRDSQLRDRKKEITYREYFNLSRRIEMIGDRIIRTRLKDILSEIKHEKSENELKAEELERQAQELRNKLN